MTLVAGIWLIVSGVTPFTEDAREMLVTLHVPLPLIEASHFIGSVAGLGLILVARGILHRLDVAWWIASGLSLIAAVLALPKGIALHEAELLLSLLVLLVISRRQFDRRSSLFAQHLEPEWLVALGGVIVACAWVLYLRLQGGRLQQPPVVAVRARRPGAALAARAHRRGAAGARLRAVAAAAAARG